MRTEYNFKEMKVKRRGVLPIFKAPHKVKITISLDQDIIEHFKAKVSEKGALPYQTQINQSLRQMLDPQNIGVSSGALKQELLQDKAFIHLLAQKVAHDQLQK